MKYMGRTIATASPWTKLNVTRTIVSTLAAIYRKEGSFLIARKRVQSQES